MVVVIETKRLILQEMTDEDFTALSNVLRDRDGKPYDDEYIWRWINWCKKSYKENRFGHYAVVYKETGEMIGSAGISMQYINFSWKPEIGYHLKSDYRRQGLGKEMALAIRDFFFNNFGYSAVYSYMDNDNIASAKTAESIGMKFVQLFSDKNGDTYRVYKLTREEWKALLPQK